MSGNPGNLVEEENDLFHQIQLQHPNQSFQCQVRLGRRGLGGGVAVLFQGLKFGGGDIEVGNRSKQIDNVGYERSGCDW